MFTFNSGIRTNYVVTTQLYSQQLEWGFGNLFSSIEKHHNQNLDLESKFKLACFWDVPNSQ